MSTVATRYVVTRNGEHIATCDRHHWGVHFVDLSQEAAEALRAAMHAGRWNETEWERFARMVTLLMRMGDVQEYALPDGAK